MKFKRARGLNKKQTPCTNGMFQMNAETQAVSFEAVTINKSFVGLEIPKEHAANISEENLYCIRGEEGEYEKIEKLGTVNIDLTAYILIRPEDVEKLDEVTEINNIEFSGIFYTPVDFLSTVFDKEVFGI